MNLRVGVSRKLLVRPLLPPSREKTQERNRKFSKENQISIANSHARPNPTWSYFSESRFRLECRKKRTCTKKQRKQTVIFPRVVRVLCQSIPSGLHRTI